VVFASSFACFGARGWEQFRVSAAIPQANVKLALTHGGLTVGEDGASAQMTEDIALWRAVPGMVVLVPADGVEAEQATLAAAEYVGPVYLRLGRSKEPIVVPSDYRFTIGKIATLREGKDVTLAACGIMVSRALRAAEMLAGENVQATVLNVSTVKPLDVETLAQAARVTGAFVTAEEHQVHGGMGSAVAEVLAQTHPVPVEFVGVDDVFGESGKPDELLEKYGLTAEAVAAAAHRAIARHS
jgi:transketolase